MSTRTNLDVSLTAATVDDIGFLFNLKSEPESVRWGGFAQVPLYATIKEHYERILREGVQTTLIVRLSGEPAGVISYRLSDDGDCVDYSINLSSRFSGQGLGVAALKQSIVLLSQPGSSCRRIVALIRDDNARSQRIFNAAGYERTAVFEDRHLGADAKSVRLHVWVRLLA